MVYFSKLANNLTHRQIHILDFFHPNFLHHPIFFVPISQKMPVVNFFWTENKFYHTLLNILPLKMVLTSNKLPFLQYDPNFDAEMLKEKSRNSAKSCGKNPKKGWKKSQNTHFGHPPTPSYVPGIFHHPLVYFEIFLSIQTFPTPLLQRFVKAAFLLWFIFCTFIRNLCTQVHLKVS